MDFDFQPKNKNTKTPKNHLAALGEALDLAFEFQPKNENTKKPKNHLAALCEALAPRSLILAP